MDDCEHLLLYLPGTDRASQETAISGFCQQNLVGICNSVWCHVPLDQQERCNHRFFLMQFTQAATYFKSPSLSSYKCFSPLQPQPRPHQSPQVTSPHQAGLLSQSGIKGGPSTKHGLVYYLEQTSILLTRKSGMAPYMWGLYKDL